MSSRSNIVKKAREVGGDAVIKLHTQSQLESLYSAGGASAYAYGVHIHAKNYESSEKLNSKYAVVKYLDNQKQLGTVIPATKNITDIEKKQNSLVR